MSCCRDPAGDDDDVADDDAPDDDDPAADDDDDAAPGPVLQIQPGFGFGERPVGCAGQVLVTLANAGDAPLSLFGVALVEPSGSGELALAEPVPPAVLAPGEGVELVVVHAPADLFPDAATLVVLSDDATASEQHAAFSGGARPAEAAADSYLQEGNRSVDVLWVVDNSCSMALEQEALGDNFGSFLAIVESLDLDYHVGVVSTDRDDGGVLHGDVPFVTPSTPDREAVFADNVLLGQLGSGTEQGLDMALAALTAPAAAPSVAVAIDGVPAASGWTFDAVLNAVVFDVGAVPQDGSLVSIDYLVAQECTD